jgi:hypothetical protein
MSTSALPNLNEDISVLKDEEIDAVAGGFSPLFAVGFAIGVVAYNVKNDRPWYEF